MSRSAGSEAVVELPVVESVPHCTRNVLRYLEGDRMKEAFRKGGFSFKKTIVETKDIYSTVYSGKGKKKKKFEVFGGCLVKVRLSGKVGERIHIFVAENTMIIDKKEVRPIIVSCYNAKRGLMHYVAADEPDSVEELKCSDSTYFSVETYFNWDCAEDGIAKAVEQYYELCRTGLPHEEYVKRVERIAAKQEV